MEKLLAELQQIAVKIKDKDIALGTELESVRGKQDVLDALISENKELAKSLKKREKELIPMENLAKATQDLEEAKRALRTEKAEAETATAKVNKDLDKKQAEIAQALAYLESKEKDLAKKLEKLEKDKKTYKEQVIKDVHKNLKVSVQ